MIFQSVGEIWIVFPSAYFLQNKWKVESPTLLESARILLQVKNLPDQMASEHRIDACSDP